MQNAQDLFPDRIEKLLKDLDRMMTVLRDAATSNVVDENNFVEGAGQHGALRIEMRTRIRTIEDADQVLNWCPWPIVRLWLRPIPSEQYW